MTRKRCNRRIRQLANPIDTAMRGAQTVSSNENGTMLKLMNRSALDALRKGEADDDAIGALANVLNMARALVRHRRHLGRDYLEEINQAQEALLTIGLRSHQHGGRYIARGAELDAIVTVIDLHEQQLDICDVRTLHKAALTIKGVIAGGHAHEVFA